MSSKSIYDRYESKGPSDTDERAAAWLFVFCAAKLLIKTEVDTLGIPTAEDLAQVEMVTISERYLGEIDGYACYCREVEEGQTLPEGLLFRDLRSLLGEMDEEIFLVAGRAFQIVNWNRMHRFCGRCGQATETQPHELAKKCTACGAIFYPRISPAVIVAVKREDKILLAHNVNFRPNWYSIIAGFVEPGETFEDCVRRELWEEVRIQVKNIRYFGSQPWPFPDSLMVGFTAEYESGEITVDGVEIEEAGWYRADEMPPHPATTSISGRLIRAVMGEG